MSVTVKRNTVKNIPTSSAVITPMNMKNAAGDVDLAWRWLN